LQLSTPGDLDSFGTSAFIGHAYQHSSFFAQPHLQRASHSTITTTQQHSTAQRALASRSKRWRYPSEGAEHISLNQSITHHDTIQERPHMR
jgi:hypothetical protein